MIELMPIYNQLREIAEKADEERLSVMWEGVRDEYPAFAYHLEQCASLPSPQDVINYLTSQDRRFAVLQFLPQSLPTIEFMQKFFRSRQGEKNVQQKVGTVKRAGNDHHNQSGNQSRVNRRRHSR